MVEGGTEGDVKHVCSCVQDMISRVMTFLLIEPVLFCERQMMLINRREEEEVGQGGAQMDASHLWGKAPGGSPPPTPEEVLGRGSISSLVSSMGVMRASSSDRGTNSGWAMKLWMELRDSGLCSPSYRELRNAFTTLI